MSDHNDPEFGFDKTAALSDPGPVAQHRPFADDGVTYCGIDGHEGCGELWPCSTIRALNEERQRPLWERYEVLRKQADALQQADALREQGTSETAGSARPIPREGSERPRLAIVEASLKIANSERDILAVKLAERDAEALDAQIALHLARVHDREQGVVIKNLTAEVDRLAGSSVAHVLRIANGLRNTIAERDATIERLCAQLNEATNVPDAPTEPAPELEREADAPTAAEVRAIAWGRP